MKIISKHSDFYDSVLGYGVDSSITYVRKSTEVKFDLNFSFFNFSKFKMNSGHKKLLNSFSPELKRVSTYFIKENQKTSFVCNISDFNSNKYLDMRLQYIIFCGEIIPLITLNYSKSLKLVYESFYDYKSFIEGIKRLFDKYELEKITSFLNNNKSLFYSENNKSKVIKMFFENSPKLECEDLHHEVDCPIILFSGKEYIKNPILKKYSFARRYDTFSTYQKLEMFISGVLGGQSPKMVEIEDIYRLEAHGFDKKTSFRKSKE
jgi:hypothetical protein